MKRLISIGIVLLFGLQILSMLPMAEAKVIGKHIPEEDDRYDSFDDGEDGLEADNFLPYGNDPGLYGFTPIAPGSGDDYLEFTFNSTDGASGRYLSYIGNYHSIEFDIKVIDQTYSWKETIDAFPSLRLQTSVNTGLYIQMHPISSDYFYYNNGTVSKYLWSMESEQIYYKLPRETWYHMIMSWNNTDGKFDVNFFGHNRTYNYTFDSWAVTYPGYLSLRIGASENWNGIICINNMYVYEEFIEDTGIVDATEDDIDEFLWSISRAPYSWNGVLGLTYDCDAATAKSTYIIWEWLNNYSQYASRGAFYYKNDTDTVPVLHGGWSDDEDMREALLWVNSFGHEIFIHSPSYYNDTRIMMIEALEDFEDTFGHKCEMYIEHGSHWVNEEQLYDGNGTNESSPFYCIDLLSELEFVWVIQHAFMTSSAYINSIIGNGIRYPIYHDFNESFFVKNYYNLNMFRRDISSGAANLISTYTEENLDELALHHGVTIVYQHDNLGPGEPTQYYNNWTDGDGSGLRTEIADAWLYAMGNEIYFRNAGEILKYQRTIENCVLEVYNHRLIITNPTDWAADGVTLLCHQRTVADRIVPYHLVDDSTKKIYYMNQEGEVNIGELPAYTSRAFTIRSTEVEQLFETGFGHDIASSNYNDEDTGRFIRSFTYDPNIKEYEFQFNNDTTLSTYADQWIKIGGELTGRPFYLDDPIANSFTNTTYIPYSNYEWVRNFAHYGDMDQLSDKTITYKSMPIKIESNYPLFYQGIKYDPDAIDAGDIFLRLKLTVPQANTPVSFTVYDIYPDMDYQVLVDSIYDQTINSTATETDFDLTLNVGVYILTVVIDRPIMDWFSADWIISIIGAVGIFGMMLTPVAVIYFIREGDEGTMAGIAVGISMFIACMGFTIVWLTV